MSNELQCTICNQQNNIGIVLKEHYICRSCEKEMVKTPPSVGKYEDYMEKIKKMLF